MTTERDIFKDKIKAFVAERDAVLIEGNLEGLRAFSVKHNPGFEIPPDDILEVSLHKARTGAKSLPLALRQASKKWLLERGSSSLDDGDLE